MEISIFLASVYVLQSNVIHILLYFQNISGITDVSKCNCTCHFFDLEPLKWIHLFESYFLRFMSVFRHF